MIGLSWQQIGDASSGDKPRRLKSRTRFMRTRRVFGIGSYEFEKKGHRCCSEPRYARKEPIDWSASSTAVANDPRRRNLAMRPKLVVDEHGAGVLTVARRCVQTRCASTSPFGRVGPSALGHAAP
jgi:hypothetical protein